MPRPAVSVRGFVDDGEQIFFDQWSSMGNAKNDAINSLASSAVSTKTWHC